MPILRAMAPPQRYFFIMRALYCAIGAKNGGLQAANYCTTRVSTAPHSPAQVGRAIATGLNSWPRGNKAVESQPGTICNAQVGAKQKQTRTVTKKKEGKTTQTKIN